jgi:hypothetical protein
MRTLFARCSLGLAIAAAIPGQAPVPPKATAQKPPAHEQATWVLGWEAKLGVNESQFQEFGMSKLTADEASRLFAHFIANQPSFTCYKLYPESQKDELTHVHLYVDRPLTAGKSRATTSMGCPKMKISAAFKVGY